MKEHDTLELDGVGEVKHFSLFNGCTTLGPILTQNIDGVRFRTTSNLLSPRGLLPCPLYLKEPPSPSVPL